MRRRFLLLVSVAALIGCGGGPIPMRDVNLGEASVLEVGETVRIPGEGTLLTVESVAEDSRCPVNADCIHAGRIRVALRITTPRGIFTQETQLPAPEAEAAVVPPSGYRAALTEATPYPSVDTRIAPKDYRLTLTLAKVN